MRISLGSRDDSKEQSESLEKDTGLETLTRSIVRLQTLSLTTMRRWILKAKLPLRGDSGVSVCAFQFAKEQDSRLEQVEIVKILGSAPWRSLSLMMHIMWKQNHHFGRLKSNFQAVYNLLWRVLSSNPAQRQIPLHNPNPLHHFRNPCRHAWLARQDLNLRPRQPTVLPQRHDQKVSRPRRHLDHLKVVSRPTINLVLAPGPTATTLNRTNDFRNPYRNTCRHLGLERQDQETQSQPQTVGSSFDKTRPKGVEAKRRPRLRKRHPETKTGLSPNTSCNYYNATLNPSHVGLFCVKPSRFSKENEALYTVGICFPATYPLNCDTSDLDDAVEWQWHCTFSLPRGPRRRTQTSATVP